MAVRLKRQKVGLTVLGRPEVKGIRVRVRRQGQGKERDSTGGYICPSGQLANRSTGQPPRAPYLVSVALVTLFLAGS